MEGDGRYSPSLLKEYLFTVCNLSHELVNPQQFTHLISTVSQYQLIPGILSQFIDDPWDVLIRILPFSKTTLIDVTLPFVVPTINSSEKRKRILARYILYKQQVIGIKTCSKVRRGEQENGQFETRFIWGQIKVPEKIIKFYEANSISNYERKVRAGDFYLVTNKFKIAMFFQSQLSQPNILYAYIKMGCEVISIVNDEEFNYVQFVNNYSSANIREREKIREGMASKIIRVREICLKYNVFLLYSGCRTCPSLNNIYYSKSFIEHGDETDANNYSFTEFYDVEFMPVVDVSRSINHLSQPEYNPNLVNSSLVMEFEQNRLKRHQLLTSDHILKNQLPSIQNQMELLQAITMDTSRFQILPLSLKNHQKLQKYATRLQQKQNTSQRQKLITSQLISGRSMIRCMYVFNMINFFILSKKKDHQVPFTIGVPFTKKTKNLFDTIVYVFDNMKDFEQHFISQEYLFEFKDLVQLYRFKNQLNKQHDYSSQQKLIRNITGDSTLVIPSLEELLRVHSKEKALYLCADDEQQRSFFKLACKELDINVTFIDVLLVDQFNLPLQIKPQHSFYEKYLELEKEKNILLQNEVKLRIQDQKIIRKKKKIIQYPQDFLKLRKQVLRKRFSTIQQALRFIILKKKFQYKSQNSHLWTELIKKLADKYRNSIKSIFPINRFFITNSDNQVMFKVSTLSQQIIKKKKNKIISLLNGDQDLQDQLANVQPNQSNKHNQQEKSLQKNQTQLKPNNEEQIYLQRLQRCKKFIALKQKNLTANFHRCNAEFNKNWLQKCKNCYQSICLACIQLITGLNRPEISKQLYKFCPVCNKTCKCDTCLKMNLKNLSNFQLKMDQKLMKQLFQDENQQQNKLQNQKSIALLSEKQQVLIKTFSDGQPLRKIEMKVCKRCQLWNIGEKRSIWVECITCGIQDCYFCVQSKYEQVKFKPLTQIGFYRNWKCFDCDEHWKRHNDAKRVSKKLAKNNDSRVFGGGMIQEKSKVMDENMIVEQKKQVEKEMNVGRRDERYSVRSNFSFEERRQASEDWLPSFYIPQIDPETKNLIYPLPQGVENKEKVDEEKDNVEKRIPMLVPPQPPRPLIEILPAGQDSVSEDGKEKKIKIIERRRVRSSDSGYDSQEDRRRQRRRDKRKGGKGRKHKKRTRSKNRQGKAVWNLKKNKRHRSSSSSSLNSSSSSSSSSSDSSSRSYSRQHSSKSFSDDSFRARKIRENKLNRKDPTRIRKNNSSSSQQFSSSSSSRKSLPKFKQKIPSKPNLPQNKQNTIIPNKQPIFNTQNKPRVVPKEQVKPRERVIPQRQRSREKITQPTFRPNQNKRNKSSSDSQQSTRNTLRKKLKQQKQQNNQLSSTIKTLKTTTNLQTTQQKDTKTHIQQVNIQKKDNLPSPFIYNNISSKNNLPPDNQSTKNSFNTSYRPGIRSLMPQKNMNVSFYAEYQKKFSEKQKSQQKIQDPDQGKEFIIKRNKKNKYPDQDIDY